MFKNQCTLLPLIQVIALIYVAEAKVHTVKWIQILAMRKIYVLCVYKCMPKILPAIKKEVSL